MDANESEVDVLSVEARVAISQWAVALTALVGDLMGEIEALTAKMEQMRVELANARATYDAVLTDEGTYEPIQF